MSITGIEPLVGHNEQTFMVMLIDDQPIVAEQVRRDLLEDSRIDFHYCADPNEALAVAESVNPTVILLDLLMPNIDGISAIKMFRTNVYTQEIPIVVLSSKEDAAMKAQAFAAGANDYLVKMPDKVELVARVVYHSLACIHKKQRDDAYRALRESQRKMEEKNIQLMQQSSIDGLTGISNRRHFDELLTGIWGNAQRTSTAIAIIMIDIDYFKLFNDKYGHIDGDDCLKVVARVLSEDIPRATDFIARYGGEEFAVVLFATDSDGAAIVAERLRKNVAELQIPNEDSKVSDYVSISAGVASTIPVPEAGQTQLIEAADAALYKAKEKGRNQVITSEMMDKS
jgi:two-component system chemotaxis family response regulator WspR